ncbi:MAG: hypothetical protein IPM24_03785 [Bryobacterales bacterium]|nr:hypothetical protein [Bryobacterales bacterium]
MDVASKFSFRDAQRRHRFDHSVNASWAGDNRRTIVAISTPVESTRHQGAEMTITLDPESAQDRLESLALEGLLSGDPIEPGPAYWEEKHRRLDESLRQQ